MNRVRVTWLPPVSHAIAGAVACLLGFSYCSDGAMRSLVVYFLLGGVAITWTRRPPIAPSPLLGTL